MLKFECGVSGSAGPYRKDLGKTNTWLRNQGPFTKEVRRIFGVISENSALTFTKETKLAIRTKTGGEPCHDPNLLEKSRIRIQRLAKLATPPTRYLPEHPKACRIIAVLES